jgi:SIR2-like domain
MSGDSVPYGVISQALREGRVIPFLGAGASLGDRPKPPAWKKGQSPFLPTAWELASHLATMSNLDPKLPRELPAIAQYYAAEAAGRQGLDRELHAIFDDDYKLPPLHTMLAGIDAALLIVTTNYDDLVERALAGRRFDVVIHKTGTSRVLWRPHQGDAVEVGVQQLDIDMSSTTVVYKLHGSVERGAPADDGDASLGDYLITEGDYLDFLVGMTRSRVIPRTIGQAFTRRHFLFLGYGLRDWNIRIILSQLERGLRQKRRRNLLSWAIDADPSPLDRRFWKDRGIEVYKETIEDFVKGVQRPG